MKFLKLFIEALGIFAIIGWIILWLAGVSVGRTREDDCDED